MSQKFFAEFFSMERYNQMVNDITNFTQLQGETMCGAWNRFKDLLRRCPQYDLTAGNQVRIFFNGCKPEVTMVLNGAAGGTIKTLRANETFELIKRMAANENQVMSSKPKRGILQLEGNDAVLAENSLLSQQVANLTSRLDKMQFAGVQTKAAVVCEYCQDNHESNECPSLLASDSPQQMQMNGIWYNQRPQQQNVQRGQNYPSGGNNFQKRGQGGGIDYSSNNYLQPPRIPYKEPSDLEKLVGQMAQHSNVFMEETRANTKNTQASIRNLENQIGQLAKQMADRTLAPEKPNTNVEANEKLKAVEEPEKEVVIPAEVEKPVEKKKFELNPEYMRAMAPYPERFKDDAQKQHYARKHKLQECQTVALTEECSAIIEKKFPCKRRDPGSCNIPIVIGNKNVGKALCDLGASINLMPLSVYKSLGTSELKPSKISLQLADRSLRKPSGDCFRLDALEELVEEEKSSIQELEEELEARDIVPFEEEKSVVFEVLEKKDSDKEDGAPKIELKDSDKDPPSRTHKILNKDDDKNVREPQGRNNLTKKKATRKEVVSKWMTPSNSNPHGYLLVASEKRFLPEPSLSLEAR
ncbi:uncharacterized protein LOC133308394 [Gastrolobium bilobum]|uniref:uncharacterized protein LOC133308394 n=1 Tax=Gastrolobium bilobum TaxID=150636 RepID=UPI002AAF49D2|nr:uncharacterized protein LOC133308394 [Gastrolobium bilobum]